MKRVLITLTAIATLTTGIYAQKSSEELHYVTGHNSVYQACMDSTPWKTLTDDQKEQADYNCMDEQQLCEDELYTFCTDSSLKDSVNEEEFCGQLVEDHCDQNLVTIDGATDIIIKNSIN
jgi:hypothetical protein